MLTWSTVSVMGGAALLVGLALLNGPGPFRLTEAADSVTTGAPAGQATPASRKTPATPLQGPALVVPQEIQAMLERRERILDDKEDQLKAEEATLAKMKAEIQVLLDRHKEAIRAAERAEKKLRAKDAQARAASQQRKTAGQGGAASASESEQARLKKVAKMYEAMPPEEAATRVERMPTDVALKVLQLVRPKTAGNILAQVQPDKAAQLTERILKQK